MEVSKSGPGLDDGLSPSRITDYFNSSKVKTRGKPREKRALKTSIYLTPESSPGNDFGTDSDDIVSNKNTDTNQDCCGGTDSLKDVVTDKAARSECHETTDSQTADVKQNREVTSFSSTNACPDLSSGVTEAIPSSEAKKVGKEDIETVPENSNLKLNPTKSTKGKKPSTATTCKESELASPSCPRPKMRRGAKSKSKSDDLAAPTSEPIKPKPGRRKKKEPEPVQTSFITDFFPVRRSGRVAESEIEKEKRHQLEQQILSKCEDGLRVTEFESKGRGVIATKNFQKGDFVVEYAGDLIDAVTAKQREKDYATNPLIGSYMYFFSDGIKQWCIDATAETGLLGRLINHSREGNCRTKVIRVQDKPHLIFVAKKNIASGEELSYDYGDRSKASLEAHPWLKS